MASGRDHEASLVGVFVPEAARVDRIECGEVGIVAASIRDPKSVQIGDTLTESGRPADAPLSGFQPLQPMVWSGLYPADSGDYDALRSAIEKLQLNDSSFSADPESSGALGFGFRCGYLGLLHLEIAQERLEREYGLDLILTAPTVVYKVLLKSGAEIELHRPSDLPPLGEVEQIREPMILAQIHVPSDYIGPVIALCQERRGAQRDLRMHSDRRAVLRYQLPLAEVAVDFYDRLKSSTRGYASMDYELVGFEPENLVRVDVLVNGEPVDALSIITHRDSAHRRGLSLIRKMKEFIPRQMYEVAIQASIGTRVISRVNVKALRKNVTSKCYGGDVTRKKKLLQRQKEGKKRMKKLGQVEIPQEAFLAVLSAGDEAN